MLIFVIIAYALSCPYESTYANVTQIDSLIPTHQIAIQLKTPITLKNTDILSNITVYTRILEFTKVNLTINYSLQQAVTFIYTNNSYVSNGEAILNSSLELELSYQNDSITLNSIQYTPASSFSFIGFMYPNQNYQYAQNLINQLISSEISTVYSTMNFNFQQITGIYTYQYKNINSQLQEIQFQFQLGSEQYDDFMLSMNGQLLIINYNNNLCIETQLPTNYQSYQQLQIFSTSILESIISYAFEQGYFNTEITDNWKSDKFQFYIGSFVYFMKDLDNLDPQIPVNGNCNVTQTPIFTLKNITLNYQCDLIFQEIDFLQVNLTLNLNIELLLKSESISILSKNYTYSSQYKSYQYELRQERQYMMTLYLKSILDKAFNNAEIFGTGFKTLKRSNPQISFNSNYLMLYDE